MESSRGVKRPWLSEDVDAPPIFWPVALPQVHIRLRANGYATYKLKVYPETTFKQILRTYRKARDVAPDKGLVLSYRGQELFGADTVRDSAVRNMAELDVHVVWQRPKALPLHKTQQRSAEHGTTTATTEDDSRGKAEPSKMHVAREKLPQGSQQGKPKQDAERETLRQELQEEMEREELDIAELQRGRLVREKAQQKLQEEIRSYDAERRELLRQRRAEKKLQHERLEQNRLQQTLRQIVMMEEDRTQQMHEGQWTLQRYHAEDWENAEFRRVRAERLKQAHMAQKRFIRELPKQRDEDVRRNELVWQAEEYKGLMKHTGREVSSTMALIHVCSMYQFELQRTLEEPHASSNRDLSSNSCRSETMVAAPQPQPSAAQNEADPGTFQLAVPDEFMMRPNAGVVNGSIAILCAALGQQNNRQLQMGLIGACHSDPKVLRYANMMRMTHEAGLRRTRLGLEL